MAVAYGGFTQAGLLAQQYPPPLLPKPGKDNVRLQKLLKRSAKKKASVQAPPSSAPFRSSLSPVNEASADLEHSDHSTPPRTPETPSRLYGGGGGVQPQPPRFTVRPLYQHVASPYPQRAAYGRAARFSPQPAAFPPYSPHVTPVSSHPAQLFRASPAPGPVMLLPPPPIPAAGSFLPEVTLSPPESGSSPAVAAAPQPKPASQVLASYSPTGGQAAVRPLTVVTPYGKSKSPRPTFKATESSRSPKPMFEVPQIRMYTASTSYYESSRTTPVYDTAELTAIGSTAPKTEDPAPSGGTPTPEIKRATPTSEVKRVTPTFEFQTSKTPTGRPRTPAYHVGRAPTPVFEISKPNPLLFAVSPTPSASSLSTVTSEPRPAETLLNGDIPSEVTPEAKPTQQTLTRSKSEPFLVKTQTTTASTVASQSYRRSRTPTSEASRLRTSSPGYIRPKTPTGASSVAIQRPKTPTQVGQKSKSGYRGLTPVEYAAYGGIKTFTPAYGIMGSTTSLEEEPKQEPAKIQEVPTKEPDAMSTEPPKVEPKGFPPVPEIVVSEAQDISGTTPDPVVVTVKKEETVIQETPQTKPAEVKSLEKEEAKVQEETKPEPKPPETKGPPPPKAVDPLKAVRKLFGRAKPADTETETAEPPKPPAATAETSKPSPAAAAAPPPPPAAAATTTEKETKKEEAAVKPAPEKKEGDESIPAAEPLLKVVQKPKGAKLKASGWSRLKKHMVVEQEEPQFPVSDSPKETAAGAAEKVQKAVTPAEGKAETSPDAQDSNQSKDAPKATKMWDAVLFQMFSTKENIMHQIELNKSEQEKTQEKTSEPKEIPSFAHRLPVLLFSPRFDAKKLREAASRPVTKISTVFEMGLIGRKGKEEEPKDFNRVAKGFAST